MKTHIVWMHNKTDSKDDEPIKIKAQTPDQAREIAKEYQPHRFYIGAIYTINNFSKETGWPHKWAIKFKV